jgi:hypothetical protein
MQFSGFVGPAYETRSRYQDAQRCINWYPEINPTPGAASVMALYPTPGLATYLDATSTAGVGPVRLLYTPPTRENLLVACIGNKLVTAIPDNAGNFTLTTQTLSSSVGPMVAADNGTDILLSDGVNGYTLNIQTLAFARIQDAAYFGGRPIFLDGYFVLNKPTTAQFYWSGLYALTWDALDFATKEAWPDDIVTVWSEHRQLWLLGAQTTEIWFNTGNPDGAFERNQGAFMQHGCAAPFSVSRLGETFAFVATDERGSAIIVAAAGQGLQKISTQALDYELSTYESISDAIAFTYRDSGHEFYQVTFPTANKTWVYDISTSMWHERASLNELGELNRHRANCACNFQGQILVGDYENGLIYQYRSDVYSDNGDAIARIRRTPHIISDRNEVRYNELQIVFEPAPSEGVILETAGVYVGLSALYTFENGYDDSATGEAADVVGLGVSRVTTPIKFGDYSAQFTTYASYLFQETTNGGGNLPVPGNGEDFALGGWAYFDTAGAADGQFIFGWQSLVGNQIGLAFRLIFGELFLSVNMGTVPANTDVELLTLGNVPEDQWVYLEVNRSGNNLYSFVDGVLQATTAVTNGIINLTSRGERFTMGPDQGGGSFTNPFFLDEINMQIGSARHTSNFTPPTLGYVSSSVPRGIYAEFNGDPQAMLRWSDDGGSTWGNEHWRSIGKIGKYRDRAIWRRLGVATDRVYEVRVTDPVKAVIIDAQLDIVPGVS